MSKCSSSEDECGDDIFYYRRLNRTASSAPGTHRSIETSSGSSSAIKSPQPKKQRVNVRNVNEMYLKQLEVFKKRVSQLEQGAEERPIVVKSAPSSHSYTLKSNPVLSEKNSETEIITPRKIEVPPKKRCIAGLGESPKRKSIWTSTSPDLARTHSSLVLNAENSYVEPKVIVLDNQSDCSSDEYKENVDQSLTNLSSITSPSCNVSPDLSPGKNSPKKTVPASGDNMTSVDLKKYTTDPEQTVETTYQVSTLLNTTKAISQSIKKVFNSAKNTDNTNNKSENEELEYFPDEVVVRTINYSDYFMKTPKSIHTLPDQNSSSLIIKEKNREGYKQTDESIEMSLLKISTVGDCVPTFSEVVAQYSTAEARLALQKERSGEFYRKSETSTNSEGVPRRKQNTSFNFYNVAPEHTPKVSMTEVKSRLLDKEKPLSLKGSEDKKSAKKDEEVVRTSFVCCDLSLCAKIIFPKKTERFF